MRETKAPRGRNGECCCEAPNGARHPGQRFGAARPGAALSRTLSLQAPELATAAQQRPWPPSCRVGLWRWAAASHRVSSAANEAGSRGARLATGFPTAKLEAPVLICLRLKGFQLEPDRRVCRPCKHRCWVLLIGYRLPNTSDSFCQSAAWDPPGFQPGLLWKRSDLGR